MSRFLSYDSDEDMALAFDAMIVCPTYLEAVGVLKTQKITTTVARLESFARNPGFTERFEKRRDELAPLLERSLANNLLDNAARAAAVVGLAIQRAGERIEAGREMDPARVARDLSQVVSQSVDKRLAVQGRPTQITEHRDVREIVRALEALKVVQVIDSTSVEIEMET